MANKTIYVFSLCMLLFLLSCESKEERQNRLIREEQRKVELEERRKQEEKEKAIYDLYINNSLPNGSTPYSYLYGPNKACSTYGCSEVRVKTPMNSDVLVTIKNGEKVVRHAYMKSGSSFTFELPNGTYQPFFYYGKGWNPEKIMKETAMGILRGGFVSEEHFGKDNPQSLSNEILEYELILQQNGNFSTKPSSVDEAF